MLSVIHSYVVIEVSAVSLLQDAFSSAQLSSGTSIRLVSHFRIMLDVVSQVVYVVQLLPFCVLLFVHRVAAVIICAPTFEHEAIVRTALQNGLFLILFIVFVLLCVPRVITC